MVSCLGAKCHDKAIDLKVDVCVSDPSAQGFQCSKPDQSEYFLPYTESTNYVAFPPAHAKRIADRLLECAKKDCFKPEDISYGN